MAWLTDWAKRIRLDIDYTNKISASVTHFPITIFLIAGNGETEKVFDEVGANKQKMAITTSDGETQLYAEIEKWDSVNKAGIIHASRSDWIINGDTSVYLYYDNSKPDNTGYIGIVPGVAPAASVWSHACVWHLYDATTTTTADSTTNANTGTKKGINEPIETAGKIGRAQLFDGVNDYVVTATKVWDFATNYSVSAFIFLNGWGESSLGRIIDTRSGNNGWFFYVDGTTGNKCLKVSNTGANIVNSPANSLSLSTWYHVAAVIDSSGIAQLYINGAPSGDSGSLGSYTNSNDVLRLGYRITNDRWFKGIIDEIRISSTARSASWIKAEYNSENDSLHAYGIEEALGIPGVKINIGDSWKSVESMKINIGDSWKDVSSVKINIGDTWKDVF